MLELDEEVELASVVEEQEFKESFLPKKHLQDVAVNFISVRNIESRMEVVEGKNSRMNTQT